MNPSTQKTQEERDLYTVENEVNMYVGEGDRGIQKALMKNLLGLVYDKTNGIPSDLAALYRLADKLRSLGKDVPIFEFESEPHGTESDRSTPLSRWNTSSGARSDMRTRLLLPL